MTDKETHFTWTIPITIATPDNLNPDSRPTFWMLNGTWSSKAFPHDQTKWLLVNADATGKNIKGNCG